MRTDRAPAAGALALTGALPSKCWVEVGKHGEAQRMATFAMIHGAGDVGWYWHLVERELRARGHESVAPDLPCEDDSAGLPEYARTVVGAIGDRDEVVGVVQ